MPTTTPVTLTALLAGPIDLADPGRAPHPGGRPCGALCVPACVDGPHDLDLLTRPAPRPHRAVQEAEPCPP
jgi:hypothetical protein